MKQKPLALNKELRYTQNFLHSPRLVDKIVQLANIRRGGTVLEIGPGKGIITKRLAEAVDVDGQVIAVELDNRLADNLSRQFEQTPQVKVVNADILRFPLTDLPRDYAVVANVPFNITSAVLERLLSPESGPAQAHLILQTDALTGVTERGTHAETFKSLMIKPLYQIELVHRFSRSDFTPQPSVETALFAFLRRPDPLIHPAQYEVYKDFLAVVSKDRVGEGVWRRLFSKPQLHKLVDQMGLVMGRGLKSQTVEAITGVFRVFMSGGRARLDMVRGAMAALRDEQQRRDEINRIGGHRRPLQ